MPTIDREKIVHAARNQVPFEILSYAFPREMELYLEEVLTLFLKELGQIELKDHLVYCIRELTVNAKKANTKRVYFKERGLNLKNDADYEMGMKAFKEETLSNMEHFTELQVQERLYVKVIFQIQAHTLSLSVRNNVPITKKELTRVYDRIARSRAFTSMEDAFAEVLDDSEGAGLGIVIMVLMLRKMGLSESAYDLDSVGDETIATLTIPTSNVKLEKINALTAEIVEVIQSIPAFPESIQRVMAMLGDPEVDLNKVAVQMAKDPALTADLIKFVNSAYYGARKKIDSISEAVRMIGIKGLKALMYPYAAQKTLAPLVSKFKHLWDEALQVSYYVMELGRVLNFPKEELGNLQIAGLLHNLGELTLSIAHPTLSDRIDNFCKTRNITADVFEDIAGSMNQAEIGARVAEKWNFPEDLVQCLRYQNHPHRALPKHQALVCAVYLATSLQSQERDMIIYEQLNKNILKAFKITSFDHLKQIHEKIKTNWAETPK